MTPLDRAALADALAPATPETLKRDAHMAAQSQPPRGVPAYHPTEHQPARCGGTEA